MTRSGGMPTTDLISPVASVNHSIFRHGTSLARWLGRESFGQLVSYAAISDRDGFNSAPGHTHGHLR
jgi:hypothetical protein